MPCLRRLLTKKSDWWSLGCAMRRIRKRSPFRLEKVKFSASKANVHSQAGPWVYNSIGFLDSHQASSYQSVGCQFLASLVTLPCGGVHSPSEEGAFVRILLYSPD